MHFFIERIILWPTAQDRAPRQLQFERGKINLITGVSGTGKSAILAIVDYVLGSRKCAIPVGCIRTTVSWYGLVVHAGNLRMLIARKEPGSTLGSSEYHVTTGEEIATPRTVGKTTTREAFKSLMDKLAGLPSIGFDADGSGSGFLSRPSFRDMAAFNFLPQYIVANPSALFFKADTSEHRRKLETIFPFVLGAIDARHLEAEHEHAELQRTFKKLSVELKQRRRAAKAWSAEAFGLYGRAVELGLTDTSSEPPTTEEQCIRTLSRVSARSAEATPPLLSRGATEQAAILLQSVREREGELTSQLADLRSRIGRIDGLRRSTSRLGVAEGTHAERIGGVGWFREKIQDGVPCPVCRSEDADSLGHLGELAAAADQLAESQRAAKAIPAQLEAERAELARKSYGLEEEIRGVRRQRAELEEARARAGGQRLDQVYRFVGRVEQSLENLKHVSDDSALLREIEQVTRRLEELRRLVDPHEKRRRLGAALQLVADEITHFAKFLELERSDEAISLKHKELTLVFENPVSGRVDFLWELGSGANWMGYHISTMLGLHTRFLKMELSYVPSFLMIDQPSQVYFPSGVPEGADDQTPDVRATRRVFEALEEGLRRSDYEMQVIVVEHADSATLGGIETLHVVADWHDPNTDWLIPKSWME